MSFIFLHFPLEFIKGNNSLLIINCPSDFPLWIIPEWWFFYQFFLFFSFPFISTGDRYSRVVFTSARGETLWNLPAIKSMCNIDHSRVCKAKPKDVAQIRLYHWHLLPLSLGSSQKQALEDMPVKDWHQQASLTFCLFLFIFFLRRLFSFQDLVI